MRYYIDYMDDDCFDQRRGRPRSAVGQLSQSAKPFIPSQGPMEQGLPNDFAALNLASGMAKVILQIYRRNTNSIKEYDAGSQILPFPDPYQI